MQAQGGSLDLPVSPERSPAAHAAVPGQTRAISATEEAISLRLAREAGRQAHAERNLTQEEWDQWYETTVAAKTGGKGATISSSSPSSPRQQSLSAVVPSDPVERSDVSEAEEGEVGSEYDPDDPREEPEPTPSEIEAWDAEEDPEADLHELPPIRYSPRGAYLKTLGTSDPRDTPRKTPGKRLQEDSPSTIPSPQVPPSQAGDGQGEWYQARRRNRKRHQTLAPTPTSNHPQVAPAHQARGPVPGKVPRRKGTRRTEPTRPTDRVDRAHAKAPAPNLHFAERSSSTSGSGGEDDYLLQGGDEEGYTQAELDAQMEDEEASAADPARVAETAAARAHEKADLQTRMEAIRALPAAKRPSQQQGTHLRTAVPSDGSRLEHSGPTPPTPAGGKAPARPSTAARPAPTPRENQAAKAARDEAEEYGQQGKEKRNLVRQSRALPTATRREADLTPTSWLARLREPREAVPAKAGETLGVVVDGFPAAWKPSAILIAMSLASRQVAELAGVAASRHLQLAKGGWLLVFPDAAQAERFLQHGHRIQIKSADGSPIRLNIHLPGAPSERKTAADTLRAQRVFTTIPFALAQELSEEASQAKQAGSDPATVRLRQQDSLQLWLGKDADMVKGSLISVRGGVMLTFGRAEDAAASLEVGILWEGLNVRSRCRPFLPREEVTLQPCHRCCGFGHTEARCPGKPVCRSCGQKGHCEVNSKCPNRQGPPPGQHRCVACGLEGHKHGSPTCKEFQAARRATLPRAGQRIQERIRELKGSPHPMEHSIPTPTTSNSTFLETAKKAITRSSTAAPAAPPRDRLSMQVEEAEVVNASAVHREASSAREKSLELQLTTLTAASGRAVAAAEKVTAIMAETLKSLESKVQEGTPISPADTVGMLHMMMVAITTMLQLVGQPLPPTNSPAIAGHGSSHPPQ